MAHLLVDAFHRSVMAFQNDDTSIDLLDDHTLQKTVQTSFHKDKVLPGDGGDGSGYVHREASEVMVGGRCKAVYSEDGLLYDCTIIDMDRDANRCAVRYDWYLNEEEQDINDLYFSTIEHVSNGRDSEQSDEPMWHEGDLCLAKENDRSHYSSAQIESFLVDGLVNVIFTKTNSRKAVDEASLRRPSIPHSERKPKTERNAFQKGKCKTKKVETAAGMKDNDDAPYFPWNLHHMSDSLPHMPADSQPPLRKPFVPVPPPPMIPDDVHGNEEALANMLMSWYLTGYNTGYYQGLRHGS